MICRNANLRCQARQLGALSQTVQRGVGLPERKPLIIQLGFWFTEFGAAGQVVHIWSWSQP
jgi:hypothetical protein